MNKTNRAALAAAVDACREIVSRSLPPFAPARRPGSVDRVELSLRPGQHPVTMSLTRLPFEKLPWIPGNHPLERKKVAGGELAVMIEFAPGFEDPSWCKRGHVIHVLEGTLELVFEDRSERIERGDACVIAPGTGHRARNPSDVAVRLFVVSS